MTSVRHAPRFETLLGALHEVRLVSSGKHEVLLQNRDTDIRIKCVGTINGARYRWYSERAGEWVQHTHVRLLENTINFLGPYEVRRA